MNTKEIIAEIEQTRLSLTKLIDAKFDQLISNLEIFIANGEFPEFEWNVPLSVDPHVFIGEKPAALLINGERIAATSWKKVFEEVLIYCTQDPIYYDRLFHLRGKLKGNSRTFISDSPESLTRPTKIADNLYAETHYGAETLIHILVQRILFSIKYDYSNIHIVLKS